MTLKPHVQSQPTRSAVTGAKRPHLLYVEDEEMNWEVTSVHLRDRYDVARARNSQETFRILRTQSFHAILMDIQLKDSDLDGIAITQVLRGKYMGVKPSYVEGIVLPHVPIIFMTAYAARYSKSELLALGGDELITKPIDFTSLGLCVSRCLLKNITGNK